MWPSNAQNLNNINNITSKQVQIDQTKNTIHEQVPIYQTPIKQSLNIQRNNDTPPLQFDFNFYFGNLWSSGHIPLPQVEIPLNNNMNQSNRDTNMLLFKSSMEKSGYKLTPMSEIKNSNTIEYGLNNNMNNIYENELNQSEFTKKNLTELFNNAKNDEFLQSSKKRNAVDNNLNKNIYYYNSGNNFIMPNNPINPNYINNYMNNNNSNNFLYPIDLENKENKNPNRINKHQSLFNNEYESKNILINNNSNNNPIMNNYPSNNSNQSEKKDINENAEEMFNSPINKKPKKIFECSGSTMATNSSKLSTRKRRFRKNNQQLTMLSEFFNEHKHWTKNQIKEIRLKTGLKENKVYKWLWDQRNKEYKVAKFVINKKNPA